MWEFVLNKKVHIAEFMVHITSQEIDSAMHEKMFFFIINISLVCTADAVFEMWLLL